MDIVDMIVTGVLDTPTERKDPHMTDIDWPAVERRQRIRELLPALETLVTSYQEANANLIEELDEEQRTGLAPRSNTYYARDDAGVAVADVAAELLPLLREELGR